MKIIFPRHTKTDDFVRYKTINIAWQGDIILELNSCHENPPRRQNTFA